MAGEGCSLFSSFLQQFVAVVDVADNMEKLRMVEKTETEIIVFETKPRCVIHHLKHFCILLG
jgi:hypothetical protein